MVAEVCSIYLKRQDGSLELFATEGLNAEAVHNTRLKRGEGLVGRCAELGVPVNEPDAPSHPAFSYRPETGEEVYHSLLAVPILRSGQVLGVLVVQNHAFREYSDDDVETLQKQPPWWSPSIWFLGAVANAGADIEISRSLAAVITGEPLSDGIALGHVVLHEPRIVVTKLTADDPAAELAAPRSGYRLSCVPRSTRCSIRSSWPRTATIATCSKPIACSRTTAAGSGACTRPCKAGLTAGAAVERVQNSSRARMLRHSRSLLAASVSAISTIYPTAVAHSRRPRTSGANLPLDMPPDTILVARTMGPAELLDYDPQKAARPRHRGR
jgi:phosphotransferase system enzyme I (PtsP)